MSRRVCSLHSTPLHFTSAARVCIRVRVTQYTRVYTYSAAVRRDTRRGPTGRNERSPRVYQIKQRFRVHIRLYTHQLTGASSLVSSARRYLKLLEMFHCEVTCAHKHINTRLEKRVDAKSIALFGRDTHALRYTQLALLLSAPLFTSLHFTTREARRGNAACGRSGLRSAAPRGRDSCACAPNERVAAGRAVYPLATRPPFNEAAAACGSRGDGRAARRSPTRVAVV